MSSRVLRPERMDDPALDAAEHAAALGGLARLNAFSGVARVLFRELRRRAPRERSRPLRVLDLATGSGDLPVRLALAARRAGLDWQLGGVDISPRAIAAARRRAAAARVPVDLWQMDVCGERLPTDWDVLVCSLFLHHLTADAAQRLVGRMAASARCGALVCDLERSRLNILLVALATHLVSRSSVVHADGIQSVRAAWRRDELQQMLGDAGPAAVRVRRAPPCRLIAWIPAAHNRGPICPKSAG